VRRFFADAFYWIALFNRRDQFHDRVLEVSRSFRPGSVVTTDEVLSEVLTYFALDVQLRITAGYDAKGLLVDPAIRVISQSRKSFEEGLRLYCARPDKGYSLTDCISMMTMRREGLTDVLTNDRHFEQEGFRAVFRDRSN